jgi:SAM-dependent methyltransferase
VTSSDPKRRRVAESRALSDVERAATDRAFLQQSAYANSAKLNARSSIYAHLDRPYDFGLWVLGLVEWPRNARAVDVGCGPGTYLGLLREHHPSVRAIGLDLSPGMVKEASQRAPVVNGDAALLPFATDSVDRVLAPHMLYHCPDIPAAITELRRVLRPDGTLIAVTNAHDHLRELWDVYAAVTETQPSFFVDRFDLSGGEPMLRDAFDEVRIERADGTLNVPDPQPVVDYLASTFHFSTREDDSVLDQIGARVQDVIDTEGAFRIRTRGGAFVCR